MAGSTSMRRSAGIIREEPEIRLVVEIPGGRLRFRDSALVEPFLADSADIRLDVPPDPKPVEWSLVLQHSSGDGKGPGRIAFKGSVHRPGAGGASISLEASRWPLAVGIAGAVARGELNATLGAERREAHWVFSGDATAAEVVASGRGCKERRRPARAPGTVHAVWEIEGQAGSWTARRLGLTIPYARLDGSGHVRRGVRTGLPGSI